MVFQGCLTNSYQILRYSPTNILYSIICYLLSRDVFVCFKCFFVQNAGDICIDYDGLLSSPLHSFDADGETRASSESCHRHLQSPGAPEVISALGGMKRAAASGEL